MKTRLSVVFSGFLIACVGVAVTGGCSAEPEPSSADGGQDGGLADSDQNDGENEGQLGCEQSGETVTGEVNGWQIAVDGDSGRWEATPPGGQAPTLQGPGTCDDNSESAPVRIATGEPWVRGEFANFEIELESNQSDLNWLAAAEASPTVEVDDSVEILWPVVDGDGVATDVGLRFSAYDGDDLMVTVVTDGDVQTGELALDCGEEEAFFGLGSQVTGMELRGRTFPLWTQEQGNSKPEGGGLFPLNNDPEAAYAPMGIWHSSAGYSALVTHDEYSEIDLCESDESRVYLRSHGQLPGLVAVAGESIKERLSGVTEYTGRLESAPPAWVFGAWVDAVGGPWRVDEVAEVARSEGIALSAIWTEDWIGGEQTSTGYRLSYAWEWDEALYPQLPDMVDGLHDQGFAFLGYFNPFVPDTVAMWDEGVENGYLVANEEGETYTFLDPAFRTASLIDLTNAEARQWLYDYQVAAVEEIGLDGWMADFAEWLPEDAVMDDGSTGWQMHNRYPLMWQEANQRALKEARQAQGQPDNWTYFARSGWASVNGGSAGVAPTMWGGDQNTDWGYDDGFPTIFPIAAHLGMSGVAIFGSDIAGYNSLSTTFTDKELFFRWSAAGAFHPLMRTHHGGDKCDNWHFDRDADTIAHFRRYAAIHGLLYPYFERLVVDARQRGWPMVRHPFLVEPERRALWEGDEFQFFLGDHLLVAPVLEEGAQTREVRLPQSQWWPLFGTMPVGDAEAIDGEAVATSVSAAVTELPVFVRPGTVLPLLYEVVDSFYGATAPGVSELADVADKLRLALYPAADGSLSLEAAEGQQASGQGWSDPEAMDWSTAAIDGASLPDCEDVEDAACVDIQRRLVRLFAIEDAELSVDGATLNLEASEPTDYVIAVGGDAWEQWAAATPYGGANADAESWCEGGELPE